MPKVHPLAYFYAAFAMQAAYLAFTVISLAPADVGYFFGGIAICAILSSWCGIGYSGVLLLVGAADHNKVPAAYRRATAIVAVTVLPLACVAVLVQSNSGLHLMVGLAFCTVEIASVRVADVGVTTLQALGRTSEATGAMCAFPLVRLLSGLPFVAWEPTLTNWILSYTLLQAIACLGFVAASTPLIREGKAAFNPSGWFSGWPFALGLSARTLHLESDKILLSQLSPPADAGAYATAWRGLNLLYMPIQSLIFSKLRLLIVAGASLQGTMQLALTLLRKAILLGCVASAAAALLGASLRLTSNPQAQLAGSALLWLALIPPMQASYMVLGEQLTAVGRQRFRTYAQLLIGTVGGGANLLVIPHFGWRASAIIAQLSAALLIAIFGAAVWRTNLQPGKGRAV